MKQHMIIAVTMAVVISGMVLASEDKATKVAPSADVYPNKASASPQTFNIDFGVWKPGPSPKVGTAAAGGEGDFWNVTAVPWIDDHTESDLRWATGDPCPINVRMINLAGGWSFDGKLGNKDPMLNTYNYPKNNQGGNSQVILSDIPPGKYNLYIYGCGLNQAYYGDYELKVGSKNYGRKVTSEFDVAKEDHWVEDGNYVKFPNIDVKPDDNIEILIRPGSKVSDGLRIFADAHIHGLQLIPVK